MGEHLAIDQKYNSKSIMLQHIMLSDKFTACFCCPQVAKKHFIQLLKKCINTKAKRNVFFVVQSIFFIPDIATVLNINMDL